MKRFLSHPYSLGVLVGFLMVTLFISGHILRVREFYFIGVLLIGTGLLLWPIFALVVISLPVFSPASSALRRQWVRSTLMPPLGSVLAVALFSLFA